MKVIVSTRPGRYWVEPGRGDTPDKSRAYLYDINSKKDVRHISGHPIHISKPRLIGVIDK